MKVSTIVSILALAAPVIVTAKPERKRVFKIYTPEEIQAFEDNNYDGERMLQKDDKPEKTKPPKDQKPDKNEPEPAPIAEESMSMEMTSAPSVSAVESSAPTVAAVVTDPPVASIVDTPAPTKPPVVITPAPTEPPVVTTPKPTEGVFTFQPTEPPNPFAAAGNAPDAPTSSAITVGTTLAAAAIALFVIIA